MASTSPNKGHILLYVETNPRLAAVAEAFLYKAGYEVERCQQFAQALGWLENFPQHASDLVIIDIPESKLQLNVHAFDLYNRIRKGGIANYVTSRGSAAWATTPIVLLVPFEDRSVILRRLNEAKLIPPNDVVYKPLDPQNFTDTVDKLVKGRIASHPPSSTDTPSQARANRNIYIRELMIDPDQSIAKINSRLLNLAPLEYKLLHHLATNTDIVQDERTLLKMVWNLDKARDPTVKIHINRLRQKLNKAYYGNEPYSGPSGESYGAIFIRYHNQGGYFLYSGRSELDADTSGTDETEEDLGLLTSDDSGAYLIYLEGDYLTIGDDDSGKKPEELKDLPLKSRQPGQSTIRIGRSEKDCDCVIDRKRISSSHAIIRSEGNRYFLKDANSKNGTFLCCRNHQGYNSRIEVMTDQEYLLRHGDILYFGPLAYIFEHR